MPLLAPNHSFITTCRSVKVIGHVGAKVFHTDRALACPQPQFYYGMSQCQSERLCQSKSISHRSCPSLPHNHSFTRTGRSVKVKGCQSKSISHRSCPSLPHNHSFTRTGRSVKVKDYVGAKVFHTDRALACPQPQFYYGMSQCQSERLCQSKSISHRSCPSLPHNHSFIRTDHSVKVKGCQSKSISHRSCPSLPHNHSFTRTGRSVKVKGHVGAKVFHTDRALACPQPQFYYDMSQCQSERLCQSKSISHRSCPSLTHNHSFIRTGGSERLCQSKSISHRSCPSLPHNHSFIRTDRSVKVKGYVRAKVFHTDRALACPTTTVLLGQVEVKDYVRAKVFHTDRALAWPQPQFYYGMSQCQSERLCQSKSISHRSCPSLTHNHSFIRTGRSVKVKGHVGAKVFHTDRALACPQPQFYYGMSQCQSERLCQSKSISHRSCPSLPHNHSFIRTDHSVKVKGCQSKSISHRSCPSLPHNHSFTRTGRSVKVKGHVGAKVFHTDRALACPQPQFYYGMSQCQSERLCQSKSISHRSCPSLTHNHSFIRTGGSERLCQSKSISHRSCPSLPHNHSFIRTDRSVKVKGYVRAKVFHTDRALACPTTTVLLGQVEVKDYVRAKVFHTDRALAWPQPQFYYGCRSVKVKGYVRAKVFHTDHALA